jgi:hypothetical protein
MQSASLKDAAPWHKSGVTELHIASRLRHTGKMKKGRLAKETSHFRNRLHSTRERFRF